MLTNKQNICKLLGSWIDCILWKVLRFFSLRTSKWKWLDWEISELFLPKTHRAALWNIAYRITYVEWICECICEILFPFFSLSFPNANMQQILFSNYENWNQNEIETCKTMAINNMTCHLHKFRFCSRYPQHRWERRT